MSDCQSRSCPSLVLYTLPLVYSFIFCIILHLRAINSQIHIFLFFIFVWHVFFVSFCFSSILTYSIYLDFYFDPSWKSFPLDSEFISFIFLAQQIHLALILFLYVMLWSLEYFLYFPTFTTGFVFFVCALFGYIDI